MKYCLVKFITVNILKINFFMIYMLRNIVIIVMKNIAKNYRNSKLALDARIEI